MKKVLLFCLAIFALNVSSYAQVEVTPSAEESVTVKKKMQKRAVRSEARRANSPKKGAATTPAERTQKIVDRINTKLSEQNPELALNDTQKEALTKIHMERQLVNQARPKLETEADKTAYKESRRAAAKEFKAKVRDILTPEQATAYFASKKKGKKGKRVKTKTSPEINKDAKF